MLFSDELIDVTPTIGRCQGGSNGSGPWADGPCFPGMQWAARHVQKNQVRKFISCILKTEKASSRERHSTIATKVTGDHVSN